MRIFNVDAVNPDELAGLEQRLLPDEQVRAAFQAATSTIVFTERRIVTIQLQVLLSERVETCSYSYRAMQQFALVEGTGEEEGARSELKIWLGPDPHPLHLRANPGTDLRPLHRLLVERMG